MYAADVVCFCDIPVDDLTIHMDKYSPFGLSFLKSFLLSKGANPVFYQAMNAPMTILKTPEQWEADMSDSEKRKVFNQRLRDVTPENAHELHEASRAEQFDRMIPELRLLLARLRDQHYDEAAKELPPAFWELQTFMMFLDIDVFSYFKFFDASKQEEEDDNYYMEREWRVFGDVEFGIEDVWRVILPQSFATRLRIDVPQYVGQVAFAE